MQGSMSSISDGWARYVGALGVTQIIGYGTIYYAFPILVGPAAAEFDVSETYLYAMFSIGLFLGGIVASMAGPWLDRFGAPRVMATGSGCAALLLAALGLAPNVHVFSVLVIVLEALSFLVLYDAAFAALALGVPIGTRRAITRLTLIAGFASTLFWPLTGFLTESIGWRATYLVFAALHLALALPLHLWLARLTRRSVPALSAPPKPPVLADWPLVTGTRVRPAFWLLGISFSLTGIVIAALGVHFVPTLLALGLGQQAFLIGMLMGPAQVLVRLVDATLWRNFHPLSVALISGMAIACAVAALQLAGLGLALAVAFALIFGAGQGLASIVRGAVPLALFGAEGYGRRLGHLAAMRNLTMAAAPFAFALSAESLGLRLTLHVSLAIALVGFALLFALHLLVRRTPTP
ncbi:MAG: MFS transporter [Rhodobacteraceae bacterium]|nr:MAG: MFS transporter [Paracoccaceae bacterium]